MSTYKRKVSNTFNVVYKDGEPFIQPKVLQLYLTQNIEDLGIYEDVDPNNGIIVDNNPFLIIR